MISKVGFSRLDLKRGLKIPEELTPELAEDIGIMVADGCLCQRKKKYEYEISVVGHMITDSVFVKHHVKELKKKLFGINFRFSERTEINTCLLRAYSKGLCEFYHRSINLPLGSKKEICVPRIIMDAEVDIKRAFLRGLADTDMTLTFKRGNKDFLHYPVIKLGTSSKNLVLSVKNILNNIGFEPSICCDINSSDKRTGKTYVKNELYLSGKFNLNKWIKEIGFSNYKNILRYKLWKEKGFSLPNNNIENIMSGPTGTRTQATRV